MFHTVVSSTLPLKSSYSNGVPHIAGESARELEGPGETLGCGYLGGRVEELGPDTLLHGDSSAGETFGLALLADGSGSSMADDVGSVTRPGLCEASGEASRRGLLATGDPVPHP